MKKITAIVLSGTAVLFLSACGSSGGSSSSTPDTPVAPVAPVAPLYSTIQDLEFKTLNIAEVWNHSGNVYYTTMKFTNHYISTSSGTPTLIDDTSSSYYIKLCGMAPEGGVGPNGEELTYLCLGRFGSGATMGWALSINNGGIITGNHYFSTTGDAEEAAAGLIHPSNAHGYLEGGVSDTVATNRDASGMVIASTDGVGGISEVAVSNVDDDTNREKLLSNNASNIIQPTTVQQASPEITQELNELYEVLLQIESEK